MTVNREPASDISRVAPPVLLPGQRRIRIPVLVMATLALFLVVGQSARGADLDKTLRKIEKRHEAVKGLSCSFSQNRTIRQLIHPVRLEGKLLFRKPHLLRMELRGDENLDLYCDGQTISIMDLDLEEVETHDFETMRTSGQLSRMVPFFILDSPDALRDRFDVREIDGGERKHRLEFVPLPGRNEAFESVLVDLDWLGRLRWMKVVYPNGDETATTFRRWRKRGKLDDALFRPDEDSATPVEWSGGSEL